MGLVQYNTTAALMAGAAWGEMDVDGALMSGAFGLLAFERMQGEGLVYEGKAYRFSQGGALQRADGKEPLQWMNIANFEEESVPLVFDKSMGRRALEELILEQVASVNQPLVFRFRIHCHEAHLRTYCAEGRENDLCFEHVIEKTQTYFHQEDIVLVGVGTYFPKFFAGVSPTFFHYHAIDEQKTIGGHLLDFTIQSAKYDLIRNPTFHLTLPDHPSYNSHHINGDFSDSMFDKLQRKNFHSRKWS